MDRIIKKEHAGKYGKIIAGEKGYKKTLHGTVQHVDYFGAVSFLDNEDILHLFRKVAIDSFEEMEFKPKI